MMKRVRDDLPEWETVHNKYEALSGAWKHLAQEEEDFTRKIRRKCVLCRTSMCKAHAKLFGDFIKEYTSERTRKLYDKMFG